MSQGTQAEQVAAEVAEALDGRSDTELGKLIAASGCSFLLLAGAHSENGWCWCQPVMVPCEYGQAHSHPKHREGRS